MDCAVSSRRVRMCRAFALMLCVVAWLLPAWGMAHAALPREQAALAAASDGNGQDGCDCAYERIGPKVDIGLVAMITFGLIGVLFAMSREWGTSSLRWTCRSSALLTCIAGIALLWWAGSIIYLGYNPRRADASGLGTHWLDILLGTSPKWIVALVLMGVAWPLWRRGEAGPR